MARDDLGWSALLGMGAATAAVLVAGALVGWLVDSVFSSFPVFLLVGLAIGIVGACTYTVAQFRKYLHD